MKARPRAAVVLKIMIPALAVMLPLAAFGVALDYNISGTCGSMLGCWYTPPSGYSACSYPTMDMGASTWVRDMSREFVTQVNKIPGYGSGIENINTVDSLLYEVCNSSYSPKCQDQVGGGINYQNVGLLALHGGSNPKTTPSSPTFKLGFSAYSNSNSIAGSNDCGVQMFGKMYLGLPRLKFLMMLSCDSMDNASDLPTASDEIKGWLSSTWGLHVIAGFSGENHVMATETTTTMDSFISDQKTQGIGHAWMNHFTYFSPTGNNTTVGASNCAVATMLGNTVSDASSRWNETINSPNAMPNPAYPTAVAMRGYYCGCCSDYGGAELAHCTPSC